MQFWFIEISYGLHCTKYTFAHSTWSLWAFCEIALLHIPCLYNALARLVDHAGHLIVYLELSGHFFFVRRSSFFFSFQF